MRLRPKRFIKILLCLTACSVIAISLFQQVINIRDKVNTNLKSFSYVENDRIIYYAVGDMFYFWNVTSNLKDTNEFLRKYHNLSNPWSFSIAEYANNKDMLCSGVFVLYAKSFAVLTNVLIDPSKGVGQRGGENISDVINQNADSELYKLSKGFFNLKCGENKTENHSTYLQTGIIKRTGWIGILKEDSTKLGKHYSAMLYESGDIKEPWLFKTMLWNIVGYSSPIIQYKLREVPYLEEFRQFFLIRHGVTSFQMLNCSSITVTFIGRRDYLLIQETPRVRCQEKSRMKKSLFLH